MCWSQWPTLFLALSFSSDSTELQLRRTLKELVSTLSPLATVRSRRVGCRGVEEEIAGNPATRERAEQARRLVHGCSWWRAAQQTDPRLTHQRHCPLPRPPLSERPADRLSVNLGRPTLRQTHTCPSRCPEALHCDKSPDQASYVIQALLLHPWMV